MRCRFCGEKGYNIRTCEQLKWSASSSATEVMNYRKFVFDTCKEIGLAPGCLVSVLHNRYNPEVYGVMFVTNLKFNTILRQSSIPRDKDVICLDKFLNGIILANVPNHYNGFSYRNTLINYGIAINTVKAGLTLERSRCCINKVLSPVYEDPCDSKQLEYDVVYNQIVPFIKKRIQKNRAWF